MTSFRLTQWNGPAIARQMREAQRHGIDETLQTAALQASDIAPYDTGFLASTIEAQPAVQEGSRVVGRWGNWTALYTFFVEVGARGRPGRYFLRRTADEQYPKLGQRIQAWFRAGG